MFFFKELEVRNGHNMPANKPVILVANHQNAMLDPVVLCLLNKKQLHWLTRADIFKKPRINNLLRRLNMLPVFRERDRVADLLEKNKATFDECFDRLKAGAVVCIFPEGTHRGKKQLVPLKKGLARMITGALDADVKDLVIVPVGLEYENYFEYRKNLLINFGEPISVNQLFNAEELSNPKVHAGITQIIQQKMISLMINIDNDNVYHEIMSLKPLCDSLTADGSLATEFDFFKTFSERADKNENFHHFLNHDVNEYKKLMHELHLSENLYRENINLGELMIVAFGLPFALISALVYYPIYTLTERFVAKVIKDPLFRNSIRLCFWTFLTPIYLLIIFFIAKIVTHSWNFSGAIILLLVMSGLISLQWWPVWKRLMHRIKCKEYQKSGNPKYTEWFAKRDKIIAWIKNVNTAF